MKFTELHIAVVTFHPLEFIFPFLVLSYAFFVGHMKGRKERKEEKKRREKEKKEKKNKMRENMIDRETERENTRTR